MRDNNRTKKLPGFYIALCVCIAAIGAVGFIAQRTEESRSTSAITTVAETDAPTAAAVGQTAYGGTEDAGRSAETSIKITAPPSADDKTPSAAPLETFADDTEDAAEEYADTENTAAYSAETYTEDNPDIAAAAPAKAEKKGAIFAAPLPDMEIVYGYSGETLMYNDAYGDWRTHDGIDIAADEGTPVTAAADGKVKSVGEGSCGTQVVISHDNNLDTVYAELGSTSVSEGDTVTQGTELGTVGKSVGETVRAPHLHYEIRIDNKPQDPSSY